MIILILDFIPMSIYVHNSVTNSSNSKFPYQFEFIYTNNTYMISKQAIYILFYFFASIFKISSKKCLLYWTIMIFLKLGKKFDSYVCLKFKRK